MKARTIAAGLLVLGLVVGAGESSSQPASVWALLFDNAFVGVLGRRTGTPGRRRPLLRAT